METVVAHSSVPIAAQADLAIGDQDGAVDRDRRAVDRVHHQRRVRTAVVVEHLDEAAEILFVVALWSTRIVGSSTGAMLDGLGGDCASDSAAALLVAGVSVGEAPGERDLPGRRVARVGVGSVAQHVVDQRGGRRHFGTGEGDAQRAAIVDDRREGRAAELEIVAADRE